MKNMKILILVFAILGIVALFIPMEGGVSLFAMLKAFGAAKQLVPVLAGFGLAAAMGAMGLAKPPMQMWQAGVALAGFGIVFVRTEMWKIADAFKGPVPIKLLAVAILGGVVTSIIALAKPEAKA
jgi:hypothetical protein